MVASRKASPLVSVLVLAVLAFLGFAGGVVGSILWEQDGWKELELSPETSADTLDPASLKCAEEVLTQLHAGAPLETAPPVEGDVAFGSQGLEWAIAGRPAPAGPGLTRTDRDLGSAAPEESPAPEAHGSGQAVSRTHQDSGSANSALSPTLTPAFSNQPRFISRA